MYGLSLNNQFGDDILADGKVMAVQSTGEVLNGNAMPATVLPVFNNTFSRMSYPATAYSSISQVPRAFRFAGSASLNTGFSTGGGVSIHIPDSGMTSPDRIAFFETPDAGIVGAFDYWWPRVAGQVTQPQKCYAVIPHVSASPFNYCIARLPPPGQFETNYGAQVFDESGDLIYDSRVNNVVIRDFRVYSQAEVQAVLEQDAVISFQPRAALQGRPMVSLTYFNSMWKNGNTHRVYYPLLTWDGAYFRLTRTSTNYQGLNFSYFGGAVQGFTLTVAEPEW